MPWIAAMVAGLLVYVPFELLERGFDLWLFGGLFRWIGIIWGLAMAAVVFLIVINRAERQVAKPNQ